MTIGFLYWLLMALALIFGGVLYWPAAAPPAPTSGWRPLGYSTLLWILLFLLGWQVFGWPIKG